jgi:DNA-binding NtrC family response regulator
MATDEEPRTRPLERRQRAPRREISSYELQISAPKPAPRRVERVTQPLVRIGSRPGNDICLADEAVSRLHFEIETRVDGHCLRDLGSRNGTFVDGYRAVELYLRPGARIGVGNTELVFSPLAATSEVPASDDERFGELLGSSVPMRELFALLERIAPTDVTVLVEGESGTGKELTARAIHTNSPRSAHPFVVFDCASVAENLLESELFGHERGAFTGAESRRIGRLEEANGGTLFLDELGELPLELQPKLLRALELREFRRVGSSATVKTDIRMIAATNRDLAREVNRGTFREDLYYRLAVVRVRLPPLRDRPEDIRPLVRRFLEAGCADAAEVDEVFRGISPQTWRRLFRHPFRGNVRELRNMVEQILILSEGALNDLPATGVSSAKNRAPTTVGSASTATVPIVVDQPFVAQKQQLTDAFERRYLHAMLQRHEGNISRAARAAQIDRMYFKRLMRKHGIR